MGDLRRVTAPHRLAALFFSYLAACLVAPSHCPPDARDKRMVATLACAKADMCNATRDVRFGPIADIAYATLGRFDDKARTPFLVAQ
jgi:hypothetical protein